jgi:hypothetical protein
VLSLVVPLIVAVGAVGSGIAGAVALHRYFFVERIRLRTEMRIFKYKLTAEISELIKKELRSYPDEKYYELLTILEHSTIRLIIYM